MFISDRLGVPSQRVYTDEGFLVVPARISRIGIQEYSAFEMGLTDRDPTDIIRVHRPETEVFSDTSIASFKNKPVTDNHPTELVGADNYTDLAKGFSTNEIRRDGMFVEAVLQITDGETIKRIESGKVELSNGYLCDIEWTSGQTEDGETYEAVQRNIKGNHIAIVDRGRAGPSCKLADHSLTDGEKTVKITIDGKDFEVSDEAGQAIASLQARFKDTEKEVEEKDKELEDKDKELEEKDKEMAEKEKESKKTEDSLTAKLDEAKSRVLDSVAIDTLVADRSKLISKVTTLVPGIQYDGKNSTDLMKEVVGEMCPTLNLDSKSSDYIGARFDALVENLESNPQQQLDKSLKQQFSAKDGDVDNRTADEIARENMISDSQNAWKIK